MEIAQLCEFFMLFAFGFSWPFAIHRTYRAKRVDGKSPAFMIIVLFGYLGGICARLLDGIPSNDWLVAVYLIDMVLVSTDLTLYFHYRGRTKSKSYGATGTQGGGSLRPRDA